MTQPKPKNLHTISFLVANKPGVLVRIALGFARRAFNIDSLVVSPTVNPKYSRMTITAQGNPQKLSTAKTSFLFTTIGAAVVLGAWVLAQMISDTINTIRG